MKRVMIGIFLAAVLLGGVAIYLFGPGAGQRASEREPIGQAVMSVDDVAARPDQYTREIAVRGVVSFVSANDRVAVLISESEFATCGPACPNVVLPVLWQGELPAITDRVIVRGAIEKTDKGYLFNAANAEIVERGKSDGR